MQRSGDGERDRRRLEGLVRKISSWPGEDSFCIIVESGGQELQLDFSAGIGICEEMLAGLREREGVAALSVEGAGLPADRES